MGSDTDGDRVLATLPDGARVVSTLRTDQAPPGHVYRVVDAHGELIEEFLTLIEVNAFVGRYVSPSSRPDSSAIETAVMTLSSTRDRPAGPR